ncbi:MAG: amidase [Arenicellales bacterium]|jgi:aspartyl-tRNA(Asn)/glutamyl-tRNA(Gln) amidotransferase subunit A|nr:amidase [Arenicellales bacterium]
MNNDVYESIFSLSQGYEDGSITPSSVLDRCLNRISLLEPRLGAFEVVYEEEARQAANAATQAYESGHRIGPFHGVPFALKDIVDLEGRVTTGGSKVLKDRVSPTTATIAKRLIAAGGVLVGKTKTVEVAMGGWGTNQHMGTPWNPWDLDTHRTPGGSSSGSAVAVASGMVSCAVGTDTGGSVRGPAAWCGITGLKTTEGQIPTDGIIPLSHTLDTAGPMTRSVADTALMYEVMLGHHPVDVDRDRSEGRGFYSLMSQGVTGLRLGVLNSQEREFVASDILELYDAACGVFEQLGAELVTFNGPKSFDDMKEATGVIIYSEGYFHHGDMYEQKDAPVDSDVRPRILTGRSFSAKDYVSALQQRRLDQQEFLQHLAGLSALLTPTMATPPLPLPEVDQGTTPGYFTRGGNYLGLCGLSVPMGLTAEGLPGGLQILGRGNEEGMTLRIGAAFEKEAGPFLHPSVDG